MHEGHRTQGGHLPEKDERALPVPIHLAERERHWTALEIERRSLLREGDDGRIAAVTARRGQLDDGGQVEASQPGPAAGTEQALQPFGAPLIAGRTRPRSVEVDPPERVEGPEGHLL